MYEDFDDQLKAFGINAKVLIDELEDIIKKLTPEERKEFERIKKQANDVVNNDELTFDEKMAFLNELKR